VLPKNCSLGGGARNPDWASCTILRPREIRAEFARLEAPRPARKRHATKAVSLGRCLLDNVDDVAEALAVGDGERFR
jgi:hypothetical protein